MEIYYSHWDYRGDLLADVHRYWFITAFGRLCVITEEDNITPFVLQGKAKKICIVSNNICYGPESSADDEAEQHITIAADGRVWF